MILSSASSRVRFSQRYYNPKKADKANRGISPCAISASIYQQRQRAEEDCWKFLEGCCSFVDDDDDEEEEKNLTGRRCSCCRISYTDRNPVYMLSMNSLTSITFMVNFQVKKQFDCVARFAIYNDSVI